MKVVFRNMERSELAKDAVIERIGPVMEKFPALKKESLTITMTMHNSPIQAGPDLFAVKFACQSGDFRGIVLEKSAPNLYVALADLSDHLLERLKRFSDRKRGRRVRTEPWLGSSLIGDLDDTNRSEEEKL